MTEPQRYKDLDNGHTLFIAELQLSAEVCDLYLVDVDQVFPGDDEKNVYPETYTPAMQIVAYANGVKLAERADGVKELIEAYEDIGGELVPIN